MVSAGRTRARLVGRVVDHELEVGDGGAADGGAAQGLGQRRRELEPEVMHRRRPLRALPAVDRARGQPLGARDEPHVALEALRRDEERVALVLVGDLHHQRAGHLVPPGEELVVRVDLVLHGALARDALGAQHLLDLQQHRVAVLEHGAGLRSHLHAPPLLLAR